MFKSKRCTIGCWAMSLGEFLGATFLGLLHATRDTNELVDNVKRRPFEISSVTEALALLIATKGPTGFSLIPWTTKSRKYSLLLSRIHFFNRLDNGAWSAGTTLLPLDDAEFMASIAPTNYAEAYFLRAVGGDVDLNAFTTFTPVLDVQYWDLDGVLEYSGRLLKSILYYKKKD